MDFLAQYGVRTEEYRSCISPFHSSFYHPMTFEVGRVLDNLEGQGSINPSVI